MLSEIKTLKVAELRAELQKRGLDSKGRKADLVTRLTSAVQAGTEPITSAQDNPLDGGNAPEPSCQNNTISTQVIGPSGSSWKVLADHQAQLEGSGPGPQAAPSPLSYVDKSTQTEHDSTVHTCCCSSKRFAESNPFEPSEKRLWQQLTTNGNVNNKGDGRPESQQSDARVQAEGPGSVTSSLVSQPASPAKDNEQLPCRVPDPPETEVDRKEACRTVGQPRSERGRDYYEFKEEIQYNRAKTPEPGPVSDDEMEVEGDEVRLDPYNGDLHFAVGADGSSGQPLLWEKFPLLRSGCRLTHGFTRGKVGFEVKFVERLSAATIDTLSDHEPCVLRVGWSVEDSGLQLGEEELSFGLDGAGVALSGGRAEEFGEPFSEGDVIGCYAFIGEGGQAELSFHKNGRSLGVAFRLGPASLAGRALYPHVLCKNCSVSVNLDPQGAMWYAGPPGYCPLPTLPPTLRTRGPVPPPHRRECEVLLMVGMQASGKSHWVQNHMAKNPEKRYNVLSTDFILRCMKLSNSEAQEVMLQQATRCLSHLIQIAPNQKRNFILDQANIYPSARRHKMLRFRGYLRKAVVVVPSDQEWRRRLCQQQQEEGTVVPETSLLKSKVSFTLPENGDLLEEVLFVELGHKEAQKLLADYKEEARHALPPPVKRKKQRSGRPQLHGQSQNAYHRHVYAQQSQWGHQKRPGLHPCARTQSYGYGSDPHRYRGYYQPCPVEWNVSDQNQSYYGNQEYYFSNQGFW
ncbi:heterogeneous nuclear ribonucleoprotein U-like protein 2 isoform X1 [Electrophorus electricus]|uniref:SAP domain-containing protein n=1 Tax=Electrophorus electricus TaxID=8005 RepID=A0A4W4G2P9_ELEEL|nr:heterogeneous nuclear ribonucleoprotein U-like protein 2 isoform X1 [Electrophorus electricus]